MSSNVDLDTGGSAVNEGSNTGNRSTTHSGLAEALEAVVEYMAASDSPRDCDGYTEEEFNRIQKRKEHCVQKLSAVKHPLAQAIAARLLLDRHHLNSIALIRRLADLAVSAEREGDEI